MNFRVAILQKKSLTRKYQENTDVILQKMKEAAGNAADLLLLPEAYLTGYELPISNEEALSDDNPYLKQLCDTAKELQLGVVVTAFTKGTERPQNSAYVIGKNGELLNEIFQGSYLRFCR